MSTFELSTEIAVNLLCLYVGLYLYKGRKRSKKTLTYFKKVNDFQTILLIGSGNLLYSSCCGGFGERRLFAEQFVR